MKIRCNRFFLARMAVIIQLFPPACFYILYGMVYGINPVLSEAWVWFIFVPVLFLSGITGIVLGCISSYLLLTRSRLAVAEAMIVIFCLPALFIASFYFHFALVLMAVV